MGLRLAELESTAAQMQRDGWLQRVRYHMHRIAAHPFGGTPVGAVLDDALDTSGKMIRPQLLLLCSAFGPNMNRERLCTLAGLVELTHLASLIHDDIIDEADFRRGRPSLQSKYGKDAAVYAGDFLVARIQYIEASEHFNEASATLACAITEMCAGEIGQAMCRYRLDTTISQYLDNIRGKTVELFKAACRIGSSESGCEAAFTEKLVSFGENLGIMFQLRDDYLDFTASKAEMGKATHKDFRDGIYTMPVLFALQKPEGSEELLALMEKNAREGLAETEIARAEQLVLASGGVDAAYDEVCARQRKLESILAEFPQTNATRLLHELVIKLAIPSH